MIDHQTFVPSKNLSERFQNSRCSTLSFRQWLFWKENHLYCSEKITKPMRWISHCKQQGNTHTKCSRFWIQESTWTCRNKIRKYQPHSLMSFHISEIIMATESQIWSSRKRFSTVQSTTTKSTFSSTTHQFRSSLSRNVSTLWYHID